jgi:arylsulfatase
MSAESSYEGFPGKVGRTREESTPYWQPKLKAAAGSPNIVIILMDDMGYADLGCYGSEIDTPHIDALAGRGVRFNHYTTHPICSPARAALLTGRNAHAVATGWLANNNPGYPGYLGDIPKDCATLPETLKAAGYATVGVGKWHNSTDSAVPNDTWPTARGFERFYGFLEGETSYFHPARLVMNNMVVPMDAYAPDYYSTDDWTQQAIRFVKEIRNDQPERPFFLYVANNAMHGPLQAKSNDLEKYRGKYDEGWDVLRQRRLERQISMGLVPADTKLAPHDPNVPAWDSLPVAERSLYARHMETYAAMLDCVDQNVGRLVELMRELGELDNTIFVFSSDNGGTGAGGPSGAVHFNRRFSGLKAHDVDQCVERSEWIGSARASPVYPSGWAQVSNAPFPCYKTHTAAGGRRVACIVSWPARLLQQGQIRQQFAHVTDIMPTLLDMAGVAPLVQSHGSPAKPLQGLSQLKVLQDSAAPAVRREQYYECWSHRGYYRDGWIAVSIQQLGVGINFDNWTLHHQPSDFAEAIDLRDRYPERLKELVEAFDQQAWANMVYPLDNRTILQKFQTIPATQRPETHSRRRFLPGTQTVNRSLVVPLIADRSFVISATLAHRANDEGILFALGDVSGGMVLYIESSQLHFYYNGFGDFSSLEGIPMPTGTHQVAIQFEALGQRRGRGRLLLGGQAVDDWRDLSPSLMGGFHEGLDIGIDRRAPVHWDLFQRRGNFPYSGKLQDLVIESGDLAPDSLYRAK